MRSRRGVALLVALWLIVAITTVALQFSLVARERRLIGLGASDRGHERAIASGALAQLQAQMEYVITNAPAAPPAVRSSDPWLDVDSLASGTIYVDGTPVEIVAHDLGMSINLNYATEAELRLLFGFVVGNASTADGLAQSILDWRDVDDNARPSGAERDQYLKDGLMVLPTNGLFREVDDLIGVYGMTPDLLELMRPYLTTRGSAPTRVNLNTAPEPVLRSLAGMTDAILNQILSLRSQGRRITSVDQVMNASNRGGGGGGGGGGRGAQPDLQQQRLQAVTEALTARTTVSTTDVEFTILVWNAARAQPTRLVAIMNRAGNQANITWQRW